MCRFHTRYPIWGPYSTETTLWVEGLSDDEQDQFDSVWDADEQHLSEWIESGEETPATFPCYVETVKAFNMLYSMMGRAHCEDCKPLPSQLEEDLEENYYSPEVCHCDTFEHFSYHWRCIQCVLAEEAKLVTMQQKVKFTLERESMGGHRFSRVSYPKAVHRTLLTNSPDQIMRLREISSRVELGNVRAVWESYRLVRRPQSKHNGTDSCTAWDYARWPWR